MKIDNRDIWKKPIGAALGGIVESFMLHPLDTVKTRIQVSKKNKTIRQAVEQIYNKERSIISFYRGLTPVTINLSLKYIIRFSVNYQMRSLLAGKKGYTTNFENFLSGLTAGVAEAMLLVTPFDVLKTKMQTDKFGTYTSLSGTFSHIIKTEGITGLWRGCLPTVIRQSTNQGCMFMTYGYLKCHLYPEETPTTQGAFMMGLVSSAIGPLCNTPIDTIKTRLMRQTSEFKQYNSVTDALIKIYRNEGIMGYYKGLQMRLIRLCPGAAIVWTVTENFNRYVDNL